MLVASPPFSTGYAFFAAVRASARVPACVGLALAGTEALAIVVLLVLDAVYGG
jgi:hypothetical protein